MKQILKFAFRQSNPKKQSKKVFGMIATIVMTAIMILTPVTVFADNTSLNTQHWSNPNWQNQHHAPNGWNHSHNWAYNAPQYGFENAWPVDQWGRPTTSNVAPDVTQNIRRDRHASVAPPPHGTQSGFFSGQFATDRLNPFAPMANNNPNAAHAIGVNTPTMALQPGEHGINVQSNTGNGLMASTSIPVDSAAGNNHPAGAPSGSTSAGGTGSPADIPGAQGGMTVNHTPINPNVNQPQQGVPQGRITTVTPFADGTIGRIQFPALNNRTASVREGIDMRTLDHYVGHFPGTSQWDGNIGLASHNRGPGSFFAGIWNMRPGDIIIYETTAGVRTFEVVSVNLISQDDASVLAHSHDNMLSMITCAYNQPEKRWVVRARAIS